jgi:hypothetical protein
VRAQGDGCGETLRPDGATVDLQVAVEIGVGIGTAVMALPAVRVKRSHRVGVRRAGASQRK